jgi:adenylosuccinate synthase
VAVRFSARVSGIDTLALTKLDVLDGLESIDLCTGYRLGDRVIDDFPADLKMLAACEPIYERLPGWSKPTRGATTIDALPAEAQAYVRRLEEVTGVPAGIISTGSDREETIIRDPSLL